MLQAYPHLWLCCILKIEILFHNLSLQPFDFQSLPVGSVLQQFADQLLQSAEGIKDQEPAKLVEAQFIVPKQKWVVVAVIKQVEEQSADDEGK